MGYYNSAPGAAAHLTRLQNFLNYTTNSSNPYTLIHAWEAANTPLFGNSNWAAIYHLNNANDTFFNFSANTTGCPTIKYVGLSRSAYTITLPSSVQSNSPQSWQDIISEDVNNCKIEFRDTPFSEKESAEIEKRLIDTCDLKDEEYELSFDEKGNLVFHQNSLDFAAPSNALNCAREYKDVANYAQSFLDELGLLPKESYRMGVNSIERFTMDVLNNSIKDREIIEYIVTFRRMLDGKDIMTADDEGIIVKLNKEGVSDLHYLWRDMDVLKNEEPKESLSLDTILSSYKKNDRVGRTPNAQDDVLKRVYYVDEKGTHMVVSIAEDDNYRNSVLVDAVTGTCYTEHEVSV